MLRPTMSSDLHTARSRRVGPASWLLAFALAAACQKNKDGTASPEAAGGDAAASPAEPQSLETLERELALRNGELSQAKDARQTAMSGDTDEAGQCERICSIAETICGLADSICALADDHTDDPRYAESCTRATADCEHANEACDACKG